MNKKSIVKYSLLATAASVMLGVGSYFVTQHVCESNSSPTFGERCYDYYHQMEVKQQAEREAEREAEKAARLQYRSLIAALVRGDVEAVRVAVSQGVDVNKAYDGGWLPLFAAVHGGNSDCVAILLAVGADASHGTVIRKACELGNIEIARLLLENGADHKEGIRAAAMSGNMDIVQLMLEKGADPNIGLYGAARGGNMDIVQLMLEKGADPSNGLRGAVENNHMDIVRLMLEKGADPNEGLETAAWMGREDIAKFLLAQPGADVEAYKALCERLDADLAE